MKQINIHIRDNINLILKELPPNIFLNNEVKYELILLIQIINFIITTNFYPI